MPVLHQKPIRSPPLTTMFTLKVFRVLAVRDWAAVAATTMYSWAVAVGRYTTSAIWPPGEPASVLQEVIFHEPEGTV